MGGAGGDGVVRKATGGRIGEGRARRFAGVVGPGGSQAGAQSLGVGCGGNKNRRDFVEGGGMAVMDTAQLPAAQVSPSVYVRARCCCRL